MQLRFLAGPGAVLILVGLCACGGSVDVDAVGLAPPLAVAAPSAPVPNPSISQRILECLHCAP